MRDFVLTAFIVGYLLPYSLVRPWIGILSWYWIGIMNPHRLTWGFAYSMPFAFWIGLATLVSMPFAKDRRPVPWNAPLALCAALLIYFTFTSFFAWAPDAAWQQLEKVFKIILMTIVSTMFIYGRDRIRALLMVVVCSIGFYGVKGTQFAIKTGGGRVNGVEQSFLDGNTFIGLAFCMTIPIMIFMAREEKRPWLRRGLYWMAALTFVATIFTYSRGAYIGLAIVSMIVFAHFKRKFLAALIAIPAILFVPGVLPDTISDRISQRNDSLQNYEQDGSANSRLASWSVAAGIAAAHPLTGAGFDFEVAPDEARWFSYVSPKYAWAVRSAMAAHSIYFQILGQHGYGGLFLFLAMLLSSIFSLRRMRAKAVKSPETEWIANYALGIQLGIVGYMVAGAFVSSAYFDLIYVFVAISAILSRELKKVSQTRNAETSDLQGSPATGRSISDMGKAQTA